MYTAIKNYCENGRKNGLFLMDMPTGFGKTYNVIKYIFDASIDEKNHDKRYFFITTLKKNLPKNDLEEWFKKAGKADLFKEKFLFIDSNADCVIEHLTNDVKKAIPSQITKTDEYKEFVKNVEFLQNTDKNASLKPFVSNISDNLRLKSEPAFRHLLQDLLAKEYPTVEQRIYAIKTNKNWQWIGELYPMVFTRDRQIIFMSVDKFLARNATIVEPSYMFYNSSIIDNAVIFIDEFDATKETLLKNIIQNGLRDKIDYVDLFSTIYSSLQITTFPTALTTPSQKRKDGEYANQSLQGVIEGIKEKAQTIYETFSLQFNHRTTDSEGQSRNFLFQDHQFHSVLDGNKSFITVQKDSKQKINAIRFTPNKPETEANNIQVLLGKLRGFISWFQGGINILAINYLQRKNEARKDGEDEFTLESAIRSVLALFRLNSTYIDYLTSQILISSRKGKGEIDPVVFDRSFYENGFRFYAFEDDVIHDMQSRIMMCSFQNTPEKILLRFCEKAKVIGISATATIDTVVGNYDLEYLQEKMQTAYQKMSQVDVDRLNDDFQKSQSGYDRITIHTELLGDSDYMSYSIASWDAVFPDRGLSERVFDLLHTALPQSKDENNYNKERYLRIALAYKHFICTPDIRSFLCVLTKHPKTGDSFLNLNTLQEIFKLIAAKYAPGFDSHKSVVLLDGDEFESKKTNVASRLEKGEKLFVISVYQTIGAGQNLQYKAPESIKENLVRVNDRCGDEKDYDAIYLDKPTNLLVVFNNGQVVGEEDFVKALFQYEMLQEGAELSPEETTKHIKNAFRHYISNGTAKKDFTQQNAHDTKSIRMLSTRYIIQAIGRICRTSLKNQNIYIFADRRIADGLDLSVMRNRILNKEFEALLDCVRRNGYEPPEIRSLENKAKLISSRVNKDIRNMLEEDWDDKRIQKWKALRDLVLKHPTMSEEEIKGNFEEEIKGNFPAWNYYIQLPARDNKYFYHQEEDFNNISIRFSDDATHQSIVSEVGTRLNTLMSFRGIKDLFEKEGYATTFIANDYLMSPPLWNNIYKGALGEVVGRYLFSKVLQVELDDITNPDLFELFDYKVRNMPVFVDFKNWHESTSFDWEKQINKIGRKAEKCGCKCVIIANIITEKEYHIHKTTKDGVEIFVIPALLYPNPNRVNEEAWKQIKECVERYAD